MRNYYLLTKPGIIRGNLLTATAGFLLGAQHHINLWLLLAMLSGTSLIIASACVCNNYLDRNIDQLMARTKKRSLATGSISIRNALVYTAVLLAAGVVLLAVFTNTLTLLIGIVGFIAYVFIYGYAKRRTVHGTVIGSISGAIPPVAGYTAVTGRVDGAALILFLILVCWQMPHFYAIAMYRLDDYKAARIPVLPAVTGMRATKIQILLYTFAFIVACSLLSIFGYASAAFLVTAVLLGLSWLFFGLRGLKSKNDTKWARGMFVYSLVVISVLSLAIGVDAAL